MLGVSSTASAPRLTCRSAARSPSGPHPLPLKSGRCLQVADGSRHAVDTRHHEGVALPHEGEQRLELAGAVPAGARDLLGPDLCASGNRECGVLNGEILIRGGHPRRAVDRRTSRLVLDLLRLASRKSENNPVETR